MSYFVSSLIARRHLVLGGFSLISLRPTTIIVVDEKIQTIRTWAISRASDEISSQQNRPIPLKIPLES